jgi:hypothetical protein
MLQGAYSGVVSEVIKLSLSLSLSFSWPPSFTYHLIPVQVSCIIFLITAIKMFEKSSYFVLLILASFTVGSPIAFEDTASLEGWATSTKYFFSL